MLESLLESILNFFWGFALDDRLLLVGDEFGEDIYGFAHRQVILFLILYHAVDQELWDK